MTLFQNQLQQIIYACYKTNILLNSKLLTGLNFPQKYDLISTKVLLVKSCHQ